MLSFTGEELTSNEAMYARQATYTRLRIASSVQFARRCSNRMDRCQVLAALTVRQQVSSNPTERWLILARKLSIPADANVPMKTSRPTRSTLRNEMVPSRTSVRITIATVYTVKTRPIHHHHHQRSTDVPNAV